MKKDAIQELYLWVLKRLTPDERKKIETRNKRLLNQGQLLGIEYAARLEVIVSILADQSQSDYAEARKAALKYNPD
jgi:hypothetical protein